MNKGLFVLIGTLFASIAVQAEGAEFACDRRCMVRVMDQYLAALIKRDSSGIPLSPDVKFVENAERISVGKGLWKTATAGPGNFKIYVPDPLAGQIGFIGLIEVKGKPAILGARLKLLDGKIAEIEHLVAHNIKEEARKNLSAPRPAFRNPLEDSEKISREQMLKIANSYYDAVVGADGTLAPFAQECERRENGITTVNAGEQTSEEAAKDDFSAFRIMTCSDQISTGVWASITAMNRRRFIAVDEEVGLVFAFSIIVHDGKPEIIKIAGVPGITERPNERGPYDLIAAHIFKIKSGNIHEIEAIGFAGKHGIKNGWE